MNILLTGASSGFGNLIVTDLVNAGHKVAGTVRDARGRNAEVAADLQAKGVTVVDLDVTDDASVEAGVAAAEAALGQIDVLINNAGVGVVGLQENFSSAEFQHVFDVNVFGVQRMIRAVAPGMRARGSGLIVNLSSVLGRITMPFFGPYNAAKWAVEALSENYRVELSQFGVDVVVIEPGGFATNFFSNIIQPATPDRNEGYGEMAGAPIQMLEGIGASLSQNEEQKPQIVADAVVELVGMEPGTRPFRTEVDRSGMADPIRPYNQQAEEITRNLFTAFGLEGMLQLNTANTKAS